MELLGHVRDRAVVLTELFALLRLGGATRRSSVPVGAQRLRQRVGAVRRVRLVHGGAVLLRLGGDPGAGESGDRVGSGRLRDPAQRVDGEGVVGLVEGVASAVGESEDLGGPAPGPGAVDALFARFDDAVGAEGVEVPADGGLGEPEPLREGGDRRGAVVQDGARDTVAGGPLTGREFLLRSLASLFHNAIVA